MASTDAQCRLCDLPVGGANVSDAEGNEFCCRGCKSVFAELGDVEDVSADDVRERAQDDTEREVPEDHERTFLDVTGMHCVTCEAFVETTATSEDAISDASASYVTDTVRIDHDPDAVTPAELRETVSGHGYAAYPKDDSFGRRRQRHWEFARLAAGVLVGMLVMMMYVLIIYPTYFPGFLYGSEMALFFGDSMGAAGGRYFFIVLAVLTGIVLGFTGRPILRGAYVSLRTGVPNMDLLVALAATSAYVYSLLTVATGGVHVYFDVTVAIIVVVTVGNHYKTTVKQRATDLLADLRSVQADGARVVTDEGHEDVDIEELSAGDRVLVRDGERVPVDGEVVDGEGVVDEAVVTGESLPVSKAPGEDVVGGSVVTDGALVVAVPADPTSSVDRIANLAWDFQSTSGGVQQLATTLATVFVPLVLVLAVLMTAVYLVLGATVTDALLVGLTVLIVSCPCALGLATPLAVASGVREALERNVVIFDETVFERLREASTVVFDKTGTLTTGDLDVLEADAPEDLLAAAADLESRSSHPAATAIAERFGTATDGGTATAGYTDRIERFESHAKGVSGVVAGAEVRVGHPDLFEDWTIPEAVAEAAAAARSNGRLPVVVGREGRAEGLVVLGDEFRPEWEETARSLAASGVDVVVLTGDEAEAAERLRAHDAVDRVFAGVPPEGKAETVARLAAEDEGETVMVGDGTNDAPALARADLGIAMGGGTAMAVEAADVAIVDDALESVEGIFDLSAAAGRRVKENIGWAFCYNAIAIPIAAAGLLNPLFAAVAMVTSSTLVVLNSSRSL